MTKRTFLAAPLLFLSATSLHAAPADEVAQSVSCYLQAASGQN